MQSRTLFRIIAAVAVFLLIAFCFISPISWNFSSDTTDESSLSEDEIIDEYISVEGLIVVGLVQVGSESDWRLANTASYETIFTEENGYYFIIEDGQQKQENQLKAVRNLILQQVDYIILDPIVETGWDAVLTEAKEAGIPVIIADRMVDVEDDSLYTCWIGSDFYQEGVSAANWLAEYLESHELWSAQSASAVVEEEVEDSDEDDGAAAADASTLTEGEGTDSTSKSKVSAASEVVESTINIVVLQGTLDSSAQLGRTNGFADVAATMAGWNILESSSGDFTQAKGKEVMEYFLATYDDIDVVICENDNMAFGAIEAIHEAGFTCGEGGDLIILSFDGVKDALEEIAEGNLHAVFECNPLTGPLVEQVIQDLQAGKSGEKVQYVEETYFDYTMDILSIMETRSY